MNRNIDVVEKRLNAQSPGGSVILKCKDFQILQLDIGTTNDLINAILSIEKLISLGNLIVLTLFMEKWDVILLSFTLQIRLCNIHSSIDRRQPTTP